MFEKCCICKSSAGLRGAVKSGFASARATGLRKEERRWYLGKEGLWLCPECLHKEQAHDAEVLENERKAAQKLAEERRRREEEWKREVDSFECPDKEPYKTIWSWLNKNVGKKAKVEAVIYDGSMTTLPIITDEWLIDEPYELDPVTWSWHGDYQWISDYSGKKSRKYLNGGYEHMKLEVDMKKDRGFQYAKATEKTLEYKIAYSTHEARDSFDEAMVWLRDPKDEKEIKGWSTYLFTLID